MDSEAHEHSSTGVSPASLSIEEERAGRRGAGYAWYVVGVLTLCYALSFMDRQILSLLVGPIKRDLHISDTRVGLLQGLAFALFYTLAGLPVGRLVDTSNRRNLIMAGVALWSAFTCACSIAQRFWSLFLARIGVGVGEAALNPAAFSMISDYVPKERLATAMSVFYLGAMMGSSVAFGVGGSIVELTSRIGIVSVPIIGPIASWRLTFLAVGAPGLLFALLVATIREPARRDLLRAVEGTVETLPFREIVRRLRMRWQSLAGISFGVAFQATCLYGFFSWTPTFFERVHGWTPGEAGRAVALVTLVFGCSGMLAGGALADRWHRNGVVDAPLRVGVLSAIVSGVLFPLALLTANASGVLLLMGPALFFSALPMGSSAAALQLVFPNQLRGIVSAIYLFIINMTGLSLGPLVPGLATDYLFRNEKMVGASLGLSIGAATVFMLAAFWATLAPYRAHYDAQSREQSGLFPVSRG